MAKFKNLKTGNILTATNETAIALMRGNPDRYQEIKEKKSKPKEPKETKETKETEEEKAE